MRRRRDFFAKYPIVGPPEVVEKEKKHGINAALRAQVLKTCLPHYSIPERMFFVSEHNIFSMVSDKANRCFDLDPLTQIWLDQLSVIPTDDNDYFEFHKKRTIKLA